MDDKSNDDIKPVAAKSIDPAALEMLAHADACGLETVFHRADEMKPCPIGETGACCRICSMGPCRLVGKDAEEKTGLCGADLPTIAARHFARQVAGGASAHSDHGRDMAMTLRAVALDEAAGYKVKDEQKLRSVAGYMGVPTEGRAVNEIALEVADTALAQFGQQHGEHHLQKRATPKRQTLWSELGMTPRGIDREIVEILHRTHMGEDQDAENILKPAIRTSLADGWGGCMIGTDITDILFGTPAPLSARSTWASSRTTGQRGRPRPRADPDAMMVGRARTPSSSTTPKRPARKASTWPASAAPPTKSSCGRASRLRATSCTRSWRS